MTAATQLAETMKLAGEQPSGLLEPFGAHVDSMDGDTVADCYYNAANELDGERMAALIAAAVNLIRHHGPEIARALKDAERYRWLRSNAGGINPIDSIVLLHWDAEYEVAQGDDLDAAIDARIVPEMREEP